MLLTGEPMTTLTISSKGQLVLPAALRQRLGLGPGTKLELVEESDGIKLRVLRPVPMVAVGKLAGMVKAPKTETPRRLSDFDPASLRHRVGH